MTTTASSKTRAALDEPRAGRLTVQYAPSDNKVVIENPPRFTFLPVIEEEAHYVLRLSRDPAFPADATLVFADLPLNVFTPDRVLEPGHWHWAYAVWDPTAKRPATGWSTVRDFTIVEGLPETPLPSRADRYRSVNRAHPRLWLSPDELAAFRVAVTDDADTCTWSTFFEKSVAPWLERGIIDEPPPYPNNTRTADIWRSTYIECQELIYAIRHLAIAGHVLADQAMLDRAKSFLLAIAAWDPDGTTSRAYTDEWAFRVTVALAWGYDWLFDELSEEERVTVRDVLVTRTKEVADHIINHANIHLFPYDSHAVRAVSAVLVPAAIALYDDAAEAADWLDYAIEFLFTVYSPWGDEDGGWAEGPHYWMTGMAYLIDAANLLKKYTGLDLYRRPFFQKTGDFPLYTKAPDTRRGTFGDDSTMGDLPCLKVGYNLRQYAGVTGNPAYQWYYDRLKAQDPGTEMAFYNYGWWDLNFDEMCYRHDYPIIEGAPPADGDRLHAFHGIGWAAIQHRMGDPDEHISFVFKSSPYGSISHSHGDQNAFCLSAFGEDLAIQSGHYVAFGSTMHRNWRRQTHSKNAILINGKGQYADRDKARAMQATGRLVEAVDRGDHVYIKGDATAAYRSLTPEVTGAMREVYFIHDSYFVIVDSIDAETPVTVDFLLHANHGFELGRDTFRYTGEKAGFYGKFLFSESGAPELSQHEGYGDVDPKEIEGLPVSTHLKAHFAAATRHRIATLIVPYPAASPRRVFSFLDDQGYDCDLYFTDAGENSFRVVVKKKARA
ncbi:DUF4962 domain-containing protein [Martelella endophytica]|uniref:Alginate lyase n=1 Tax=Martelella endophytica TaxID=1486262 RepID=A0A0D5LLT9_MAREN|nr:DUF4962 domain-containing protein [Martelella endophytica]AJY45121.1 alginate lyase [Martelella endophytica]